MFTRFPTHWLMEWLIDWFDILIDLIWYIDWLKITSQITFSTFSSFFPLNKIIEISTPTPNLFFPYNYSVYEIFCSSIINHVYTIGLHLIKLYYVYYIQYILSLSCWQIVINDINDIERGSLLLYKQLEVFNYIFHLLNHVSSLRSRLTICILVQYRGKIYQMKKNPNDLQ